ncbi:hypothetical protein [Kineosporia sp. R_H_3]|uniref:hypothetical protein n=1 Tax=Kineosporia sp. R_H_3 TaxID=1961848 RepID=UPI0018E9E972|nr:hypothetical protein [Kineosporia sp. R_H_3]
MHHLVGSAEIAAMLGVSRQRVVQLARTPGFPEPEADLKTGRIWSREKVAAWATATGRTIVGDAAPGSHTVTVRSEPLTVRQDGGS